MAGLELPLAQLNYQSDGESDNPNYESTLD